MIAHWLVEITIFSALGSGLIAGIFFAFSTFIMTVLARIPSEQGIVAMQAINITVLNLLFTLVFFGTAIACAILGLTSFSQLGTTSMNYLLAGSVLYLLGPLLITIIFNVPLNEKLAKLQSNSPDAAHYWAMYINKWTFWNHVRTVLAIAAMASFILSLS